MQIKIDMKIFLFLIIFFFTKQIDIYMLFMLFAVIHELGHITTGILLGFKPKMVNIIPMGISVSFIGYQNKNLKNKKILILKKILIATAGPAINFFIAIFFIFCNIDLLDIFREKIILTNLFIGFFNLIPIYPLDGGRIIKCLINIKKNLLMSYKYTYFISNLSLIILTAISSIAILYFKNMAILFIIIYLWIICIRENNIYNNKMKLYDVIYKYTEN